MLWGSVLSPMGKPLPSWTPCGPSHWELTLEDQSSAVSGGYKGRPSPSQLPRPEDTPFPPRSPKASSLPSSPLFIPPSHSLAVREGCAPAVGG